MAFWLPKGNAVKRTPAAGWHFYMIINEKDCNYLQIFVIMSASTRGFVKHLLIEISLSLYNPADLFICYGKEHNLLSVDSINLVY